MRMVKRTYSLPTDLVDEFEQRVKPRRRSSTLAHVLREWMEAEERQRLRAEIVEGLREMEEEYLAVEREWHPLDAEADRVLDE